MTSWSDDDETTATDSYYGTDQRCLRALVRHVSGPKEANSGSVETGRRLTDRCV